MTKKYKIEDFFTKSKSEKATKMPILLGGESTGCFFNVIGIESKSIQRDRIIAQVAYAEITESAGKIKDKLDRAMFEREQKELVEINLAIALVDGWSFGGFSEDKLKELLLENQGLAFGVISHATTVTNYLTKK